MQISVMQFAGQPPFFAFFPHANIDLLKKMTLAITVKFFLRATSIEILNKIPRTAHGASSVRLGDAASLLLLLAPLRESFA